LCCLSVDKDHVGMADMMAKDNKVVNKLLFQSDYYKPLSQMTFFLKKSDVL